MPYFTAILLIFCFFHNEIFAQKDAAKNDTLLQNKDIEVYNRMKRAMSNKKITQKIFSILITKPGIDFAPTNEPSVDEQFMPFEGKTVNNITIKCKSPFGYNVRNDSVEKINFLDKIGNNMHSKTKAWVIRNSLLFRKGDKIDPLIIAETESVLRNLDYVNDVFISIDSLSDEQANITVSVKDNFSTGFYLRNASSIIDMEIFDSNLLGFGNNVGFRGIYNAKRGGNFGYGIDYKYPNFLQTFVNLNASYIDDTRSRIHSYSLERPLQKSLNLFGQIAYRELQNTSSQFLFDSVMLIYNKEFSISTGYAFDFSDKNTFVVSGRYFKTKPLYNSFIIQDTAPNYQYIDNKMILFQLSLFRQRYFRDKMVNNFGKPENFAYGYNISMQIGYSKWNQFNNNGLYLSAKAAFNKRMQIGSFYFEGALSSFFNEDNAFEGVIKLKMNTFSKLYYSRKSAYRFFFNIDYAKRLNHIQGFRDYLLSNNIMSMRLPRTNPVIAEHFMLQTEVDFFSSINLLGFKVLFYNFWDFGWFARYNQKLFQNNNIFGGIGFGLRLRNDLLVFRTMELKFGFYPRLNQHIFNDFINFSSSIPNKSPNFTPKYPEEIGL